MESSFRAARDGLAATLWHDGALRPVPEIVAAVLGDLPGDGPRQPSAALDEVRRLLADGNGALRQRRNHERGGMPALLAGLVAETSQAWP